MSAAAVDIVDSVVHVVVDVGGGGNGNDEKRTQRVGQAASTPPKFRTAPSRRRTRPARSPRHSHRSELTKVCKPPQIPILSLHGLVRPLGSKDGHNMKERSTRPDKDPTPWGSRTLAG